MHLVKDMYEDVADIKKVEIAEEFCDQAFIPHLVLGTGETSTKNERVYAFHENHSEFRFDGTRHMPDSNIYTYEAMEGLTNLKNHMIVSFERFMIRTMFALNPGLSRQGILVIINGITNARQNGQEIEFVDKKTSHRSMNNASVIRAAIQEHRAVLGHVKSS